ncbi:MAG: 1,2-phenylacetyl-CoA epoxidase subunit PaaE [Salibacteraceae bacterium]
MQFNTLTVNDVRKETNDTVSVAFSIPSEINKDDYAFIPGQYITLKTTIDGEDVRRAYSVCSSPSENELRVAIKQVPGGVFSTYANNTLKIGDSLEVMTPMGHFYSEFKSANKKQYVAFAAGSGITPVLSIIKHVLETELESSFTLLYGNKDVDSIIFGKELDQIKNAYPARFNMQLVLSQENRGIDAFYGRIDAKKLPLWGKTLFNVKSVDEFFMCGPEGMTNEIRAYLSDQKVDDSKVHFELFHTSGSAEKKDVNDIPAAEKVTANMTIIMDDEQYDFELKTEGMDILQAGVEAGIDLPFSCKGGVCCTCKAKLIEGKANMTMNYSLLDEEVEAGYILTCQAHPTTEKVVVSFDD